MEYNNYEVIDGESKIAELSRTFFANVYKYMFLALAVSGFVSWYASGQNWYMEMMFTETGASPLFYITLFAPVGLVFLIQAKINKFSYTTTLALYMLYAILIGISLAFIFMMYTSASIFLTFFVTAGAFGSMALLGYYTKTDLSKMGSLLYMVFIGMFIAGIANMLMGSEMISYIISFLGLIVFTGLTAYKMQEMKKIAGEPALQGEDRKKQELLGGLILYILFINLFMSILRFVGDRG